MNNHGEFRNGRDRGSTLLSYVGLRGGDLERSTDCLSVDRLAALVNDEDYLPAVPTVTTDPQQVEVEEDDAGAAGVDSPGVGSAAGLLALAQKLHDEYVAEGQAKYDHFVSIGEAKYDAIIAEAESLLAEANAEHEHLITDARERSNEIVAEAQQKRDTILQELGSERALLQKKIEDLRTLERDHHALLKSYFEGQLIELENTGGEQTGADSGS